MEIKHIKLVPENLNLHELEDEATKAAVIKALAEAAKKNGSHPEVIKPEKEE